MIRKFWTLNINLIKVTLFQWYWGIPLRRGSKHYTDYNYTTLSDKLTWSTKLFYAIRFFRVVHQKKFTTGNYICNTVYVLQTKLFLDRQKWLKIRPTVWSSFVGSNVLLLFCCSIFQRSSIFWMFTIRRCYDVVSIL